MNHNEKQWWIFTFGYGQKHEGHYVKIYGTFDDARQKMFDRFGKDWSFQYTLQDWQDWENRRPPYLPIETMLEEIGESK